MEPSPTSLNLPKLQIHGYTLPSRWAASYQGVRAQASFCETFGLECVDVKIRRLVHAIMRARLEIVEVWSGFMNWGVPILRFHRYRGLV